MTGSPTRAVILDIEGTTTPIAFVYHTLFPYAREHAAGFLARHQGSPGCDAAVARLRQEYERDQEDAAPRSGLGPDAGPAAFAAYVEWLMDRDRKSPGLKTLQGLIWEEGYRSGELRGDVFPDVRPALEGWRAGGTRIAIYSSGSVLAQQLLFQTTSAGDLTPLIDDHFDTAVGPKHRSESYRVIVSRLGVAPETALFVSDVEHELDAARDAGLHTALCVRPPSTRAESSHQIIRSLDELTAPPIR